MALVTARSPQGNLRNTALQVPRSSTHSRSQIGWAWVFGGVIFIVLGSIGVYWGFPAWTWEHIPLHATIEALGTCAALLLGTLMLLLRGHASAAPYSIWAASGLIGMGVLDGFHAASNSGATFVWLHSIATLVGGVLFALVWLPARTLTRMVIPYVPAAIAVGACVLGALAFAVPQSIPAMLQKDDFTITAYLINMIGGIGFLIASKYFADTYLSDQKTDDLLFAVLAFLFGLAGLWFFLSQIWNASWWVWHFLRLAAYICVLGVVVLRYQQTEMALSASRQSLEHRVNELAAANQELEAFSYSVSHDLRAPIRSIDGFSQALLDDYVERLDEMGLDYLRRIKNSSRQMGRLIDGLLDLYRVMRKPLSYQPLDLSRMCSGIVEEFRQAERERWVECRIAPGLQAQGDPNLMRLVLEHLLGNAWKFTNKTSAPFIEVGRSPEKRDGKPIFFVKDNGVGFDMTYADKLFDAFQRLHTPAEFPGCGIGLATVHRIITRHGGTVWAEGEVGKGATFYFSI